jgi:hypothetical protein
MIIQRGYVALRRDAGDGREWFDMATWSGKESITKRKADYEERQQPGLKAASPVVRIVRVTVSEALGDELPRGVKSLVGKEYRFAIPGKTMKRLSKYEGEED